LDAEVKINVWEMIREIIKMSSKEIKMCLNETYSNIHIGKHLSDSFLIQNGLKQGDALSPLLWNMPLGRSQEIR
jgi:hypothetical protein